MTNNELLRASLLDIIFDKRNKEYGAYTLRKEYNQRLLISLGIGISLIIFLVWMNTVNKNESYNPGNQPENNKVVISTVVMPEEKIKKLEPPVVKPVPEPAPPKTPGPVATIDYPPIVIVPDDKPDPNAMASQADIANKQISTVNGDGKDYTGEVVQEKTVVSSVSQTEEIVPANQSIIPNSSPEFPGGQEALMKFLSRNLDTPDELQSGEKKMVRARFKVDIDGSVSLVEIIETGGNLFDKEVTRVCKKMPRWKPAIQNGQAVPMSYILPVTFIGLDQ
ncbi:MAG: energy transducer TonB [Chitinophagaceae bacterium]